MKKKTVTKTAKTKTMARKTAKRVSTRKSTRKTLDTNIGFTDECYKSIQIGRSFALMNTAGDVSQKVTGISKVKMKQAHTEDKALRAYVGKTGNVSYKMVEMDEFKRLANVIDDTACDSVSEAFETHEQLKQFIHEKGGELKP